ncbi:MAG: hypothetical protein GX581_03180 [Syntrophomonadaceae bacterium]|jgi:hypothetical protein|nr:hypothetical protein [Syntrophomonadaceae bacterium]
MNTRKKILVTILSLVFLFSITGAAFAAPADGYYVNGHRYELTLGVTDAGYLNYLEDMAAINFDFTRVIIVSNDQYADVQAAVNAGGIAEVLQPDAQQQIGTLLPETVIPVANDGAIGTEENVGDSQGVDLVLESIEISQPADKLVYNVGDSLDITGLEVKGYYDDGSSKILPVAKSNVTGFDSSAAVASQTLTITVGGKSAVYTVEIKESGTTVLLDHIAITTPAAKLVYNVGDELDLSGMVVTGYYSDGSSQPENISVSNVTGFDSSAAAASQTLTITVKDKTAEYTVEIKEKTTGPVTAVSLIENAIANFQPVNAAGKFGGEVLSVKVVGDVTVNKCDFKTDLTSINASKVQTATMTVNISPQVQTTDKDVTIANFPFAEIISGSGIGADAVAGGVVTEDANYYYIQLTNAECPTSVLKIIDAAGNVSSGTKMNFTDQKADCQITVSKATGLVVSVDNVKITGKTNVTKSTMNLANGTYNNTFWNNDGPIIYTYK